MTSGFHRNEFDSQASLELYNYLFNFSYLYDIN